MRLTPYVFIPLAFMALCSDFLARWGLEERWILPVSVLTVLFSLLMVAFGLEIMRSIRMLNQEMNEASHVQQELQAGEKVLDMLITRIDDLQRQRETLEDRRN